MWIMTIACLGEYLKLRKCPFSRFDRTLWTQVLVSKILSVCDPLIVENEESLSAIVDQSYQAMWSEVNALGNGLAELSESFQSTSAVVDMFKEQSMQRAEKYKDDMVSYLTHSMQVNQDVHDCQFEVNRALSDIKRLQELCMYLQTSSSQEQFIALWNQMKAMRDNLVQEVSRLLSNPSVHENMMSLTEKNKRILGLRRKAIIRDELIQRLANSLKERGALKPEDEELITGF